MEVYVTPRAEQDFDGVFEYIKNRWGLGTARQFVAKTDELFKMLCAYPTVGPIESGDIRGFQLSKQIRLLYRIRANKIIVLAFFDVRQDPKRRFI